MHDAIEYCYGRMGGLPERYYPATRQLDVLISPRASTDFLVSADKLSRKIFSKHLRGFPSAPCLHVQPRNGMGLPRDPTRRAHNGHRC